MISKQEFQNVVDQINGRFEWFTAKVNEQDQQIAELRAALSERGAAKAATKKSTAAKKGPANG